MVDESVWVDEKLVRSRLSRDELWLLYRLVDNQYCGFAKASASFLGFG